jgi:hypothetical protein
LAVSVTAENTSQTLRAFPPTNPIGNLVTLSQFYRLYAPYISGALPLFGVRPKNILGGELGAPANMVIQPSAAGGRTLTWNSVAGATLYRIYRSTDIAGVFTQISETSAPTYVDVEILPGTKYFYRVSALGGL